MIDLLAEMAEQVNGALRPAAMTFLRVGAAIALIPGFGEQSIPARIRLALALAFTALVAPVVADHHVGGPVILPALAEVLAGLLCGLSLRLLVMALQMAAAIAAQSASLSQLFASAGAEPQPALGTLMTLAALTLALQAGLHVKLTLFLILSYDLLPAGELPSGAMVAGWATAEAGRALSLAFSLAAPFVIAALLWNLALGVINRALPQLMVSFIGAPMLAWGGLVLSALAVPLILSVWMDAMDTALSTPFRGR